jgi:hypothetical protein
MERITAAAAGIVVVVALFGGIIFLRTIARFLRAIVWFAETAALFSFALLCGYLAYRVLWGGSDDPRVH